MKRDDNAVVDRIYEAALVPELWPAVLDDMATVSGSAFGGFFLDGPSHGMRGIASGDFDAVYQQSIRSPNAQQSPRALHLAANPYAGFQRSHDVLSSEELERDPIQHELRERGMEAQLGTFIPMPSGDVACFTVERRRQHGLHTASNIANLDRLRPHLSRAAVIAVRLGMASAQANVAALEAIGLPAAALTADGRVLAVNAVFERTRVLRPAAFGRVSIATPAADVLFQQALRESGDAALPSVRSISVVTDETGGTPLVLHLVPIRGAAHDVFARAAFLLVAIPFGADAAMPSLSLLHGLFDLTPKEAALAGALASGRTLKEAAALNGIQYSTARTHLEHIFQKTGVRQQTQLVLLLQGARPLGAAD